MKALSIVLFVFIFLLQGCFDAGSVTGGPPGGADTTVSFKATNWLLEEFVLGDVFLVDKTNASTQNIELEFQAASVTVDGLLNDCSANYTCDGLTKIKFSDLVDCTTTCCDTDQFNQFKSLLVSGISSFEVSKDRKVVFFRKDFGNYFKLKRTN